ncbi:tetratricopeptide repeat protein [Hoyosella rhizosphaerae]|uniref:tetratricopeptide repeat protein n=1 Tax=Hoyosella rhizosphaerae TaxID=1755582 RepID=UPI003570E4EC
MQYGSTLRNLGRTREAIDVLQATVPHPSIGDAGTVFLALALRDAGRTDEALLRTIEALIPHLPQYRKSATDYVRALRSASTA